MIRDSEFSIQSDLLDFDRKHLWHPYTSITDPDPVYCVKTAKGIHIELADGRQLIDGMSSWWSVIHGYNHPRLNAAAQEQLTKMSHVMFGGLTHEPAIELAQQLLNIVPCGLESVFFSDSGSVSVEVALKMALQYWQAKGVGNKTRFLALHGGYHGDTFGAMSVCDPINGMHHLFAGAMNQNFFAPRPDCRFHDAWNPHDIEKIETILKDNQAEIAAVILEPIVQGAGGMWFYHAEYLKQVRQLCNQFEVLLIADEIATGFGRTGRFFACEHANICPDILCLGKALTAGYLSLAATLTTADIGQVISEGEAGCFMHGPTFMANPLACRIAQESIELLLESNWQSNIMMIEDNLKQGLEPCRDMSGVKDVRVLGAIGVVEMETPVDVAKFQRLLVDQNVWLRPFGRLIYTMPPYCISSERLNQVTQAIVSSIKKYN